MNMYMRAQALLKAFCERMHAPVPSSTIQAVLKLVWWLLSSLQPCILWLLNPARVAVCCSSCLAVTCADNS